MRRQLKNSANDVRMQRMNTASKKVPAVSEIEYSVDNEENLNAVFAVDTTNVLLNNFEMAKKLFIANPEKFSKASENMSLKQITIYRDSSENLDFSSNGLNTPIENNNINFQQDDRVVVRTANRLGDKIKPSTRFLLSNAFEVNVDPRTIPQTSATASYLDLKNISAEQLSDAEITGDISEISFPEHNVRLISFSDYKLKTLRGGEYVYSFELTIENHIFDYIKNILLYSADAIAQVKKYMVSIDNHKRYNYFIDKVKPDAAEAIKNSFTSEPKRAPWVKATVAWESLTSLMSTDSVDRQAVMKYFHPTNNNLTTISTGIERLEKLFRNTIRHYNLSESVLFSEGSSKRFGGGAQRKSIIRTQYTFRKNFDTDDLDGMGYDYFSRNVRGLMNLKSNVMQRRAEREASRFLNGRPKAGDFKADRLTPDQKSELTSISENVFSYLTPRRIVSGDENRDLESDHGFEASFFQRLSLKKTMKRKNRKHPGKKKRNIRRKKLKGRMNLLRAASHRLGIVLESSTQDQKEAEEFLVSSEEYLGEASAFNILEGKSLTLKQQMTDFVVEEDSKMLSSFATSKAESASSAELSAQKFNKIPASLPKGELKRIPMQLKALMTVNPKRTKLNMGAHDSFRDPNTKSAASTIFTKIREVQFLSSFMKTESGLNMLNKPNWKLLDRTSFDNMPTHGYYCRLMPYTNDFYDIKDDEDIKDYNRVFKIITGDDNAE